MRVVPLYVNFGAESFRDHVDIGSARLLRPAAGGADAADDVAADAAGLRRRVRGARAATSGSTRSSSRRSSPARFSRARSRPRELGGDRIRVVDTETASLAVGLLALAIQRRLARGTTDEEIEELDRAVQARTTASSSRSRRSSTCRRAAGSGAAQALAGTLLNVKPILSVDDGVVAPDRQGARPAEGARGVRPRVHRRRPRDAPGLRVAIAHADAPEWIDVLTRPRREGAARRPRSSSSRISAPSSARTPAPARSASSGSRTSRPSLEASRPGVRPASARAHVPDLYSVPVPPRSQKPGSRSGFAGLDAAARWPRPRSAPRPEAARAPGSRRCRGSGRRCGAGSRSSGSAPSATCSPTGRAATSGRSTSERSATSSARRRR